MKIPIDQIFPDPDLPQSKTQNTRRESTRSVRSKRDPVVLFKDNGYLLLSGQRKLTAAKEAGELTVECTVKEEVTAQCGVCDSEGEIDAEQRDDIYIDADGIHRLQ